MQLDFDLHGPPEKKPDPASGPDVLTVSALTRRVRDLLEGSVGEVWVEGEISNVRRQASGHQYFTLKDEASQLGCVLFAGAASGLRGVRLTDGQSVQVFGEITVYEPRGQYQMIVRLVQDRGTGALQARFEALKRKLEAEGLFDPARKRPLPRFPRRIGLVTSPTGAAVRDFLHVLHRRHPGIQVIINPVRVQGRGAADEIARAIREFGNPEAHGVPAVDVIVVTRGGGSLEDLWEFNEETVARALAASPVPTVSAVGHEIDFTISDFVADRRAPTPSAAAEILAADCVETLAALDQTIRRMEGVTRARLELLGARLASAKNSGGLREPSRRLMECRQTLDRSALAVDDTISRAIERLRQAVATGASRLAVHAPDARVQAVRVALGHALQGIEGSFSRELTARRTRLDRAAGVLAALNPNATLARGFTITMDESGVPISNCASVGSGATLRTRFSDGEVRSRAEDRAKPEPP